MGPQRRLIFMRKILNVFALLLLFMVPLLSACGSEKTDNNAGKDSGNKKHKIGILAPAVTHGWVAAVAYHAEARAKDLANDIDYQIQTSSNAEEMTSQLDDLMT